MAFLSRILILWAILLYEQYLRHTQVSLQTNIQYLSAQQYAYHSLVTSWFDSVCIQVAHLENFRQKCSHQHEQQLSDYNV